MSKIPRKKDIQANQLTNSNQFAIRPFEEPTPAKAELSTPKSKGFKLSKIDMSPNRSPVQTYVTPIQHFRASQSNSSFAKSISTNQGNINLAKNSDKLIQKKVIQLDYEVPLDTYTIGDLAEHNIKEADAGILFIDTLKQKAEQDLGQVSKRVPNQGLFINYRTRKHENKLNTIKEKIQTYDEIMTIIIKHKGVMLKRREEKGTESIIDDSQKIDTNKVTHNHGKYIDDYLTPMISSRLNIKEKLVKQRIKDIYINNLNAAEWRTITKEVSLYNTQNEEAETYTSQITPINSEFEETHYAKYGKTGHSSASAKRSSSAEDQIDDNQKNRTTNLWKTELRKGTAGENGETVFEGFRSAALAYTGKSKRIAKNRVKRQEIARSKVYGLLEAILIDKLKKLPPEQRAEYYDNPDKIMKIDVVSTSLQTHSIFDIEKYHIDDQIAALDYYHGRQETFDVQLTGDPVSHQVTTQISTIAFNFAVNQARGLGYLGGGLKKQNEINQRAIVKLQQAYEEYKNTMEAKKKENELTDPSSNTQIDEDLAKITALWEQIQTQMFNRRLAYELPSMVGNLAFLMGRTAHFNCKSGKDRTGIDDSENKFLGHKIHTTGKVPQYENQLEGQDQENYQKLLIESGNLEVQKANTGIKGYFFTDKIAKIKVNRDVQQRFGKLLNIVKGLSKFTGS